MTARRLAALDDHARSLATGSIAWMDRYWDERAGLLWSPDDRVEAHDAPHTAEHAVRDSGWYAVGLLLRDGPGDLARAVRILETVLSEQLNEPGRPYHGTFYRAAEEPHPPAEPVVWRDYDPNWREFVATTLLLILREYEAQLPRRLADRLDAAIAAAVEGSLARSLSPSYTNIALMNAFLLCSAGCRLGRPRWVSRGERMARSIFRLFQRQRTFGEYNSPTYYGVDLYALALWRRHAPTPLLHEWGAEMEAALWREMAQLYHAGLRNLCGPFDRSYGMDMRRYVAMAGEWIAMVTGQAGAPCPRLDEAFAHASDLCFAPCVAVLGAQLPPEAEPHFLAFQGERQVERLIADSPRRVATAWLGQDRMLGGESGNRGRRGGAPFHPATVHWRIGAEEVGWIRLMDSGTVDARASRDRLEISGAGELAFEICAAGARADMIQADRWSLPGLSVQVEASAGAIQVGAGPELISVRYRVDGARPLACALETRSD